MEQQYQQWLMALSAPMVAINAHTGCTFDSLKYYPFDTTFDLKESWGITSRSGVINMILRMVDAGHARELAHYYSLWHRLSPTQWQEHVEQQSVEEQVLMQIVADTAVICSDGGIRSWDLGRLSFLCRVAQLHGWFTAEENLWFHTRLALRARHYYANWESYYAAFFVGRAYWQSLNQETPEQQQYAFYHYSGTENYIQMQQHLYCHADSPLKNLAWHIDCHEMEKPASLEEVDWS
ncbi:Protein of uncharacterised function (DUF1266) [Serratia fonticola]|uniref:DUF1266 domain-containing protein n=1 Tax=Serratia fonticola TaxID=47917 RepID=UPI0021775F04|nr:DUF1266 domain-containing protein [Serratia fonticola]CAI2007190.1 Protein of uncharacterised function (DUF1266) [Serratia fonticola]